MKIYKKIEKRNEIEKQTGKASYSTLVDRFVDNLVLCNNILNLDEFLFDNIVVGEIGEDTEIYQAYIIDIANYNIEYLQENLENTNDIIIAYSNMLDCFVLLVDHFGTSWDYVSTDIKLTDDLNEVL